MTITNPYEITSEEMLGKDLGTALIVAGIATLMIYLAGIPMHHFALVLFAGLIFAAGFVITQDRVVVIDALGSPDLARQLLAEIRKRTSLPVTDVIVTRI